MEENEKKQEDTKYTVECVECKKMFDCKGMPRNVDMCVAFEKRKGK